LNHNRFSRFNFFLDGHLESILAHMRFPSVPTESRTQIKRAGRILVDDSASKEERAMALALADKWRVCHGYPINTFQSTLHRKLKNGFADGYIVSQRLKRMPTIIKKLTRETTMQLTTMQDIGGVRAILRNVDEVYELSQQYRDKSRFKHELFRDDDYIAAPKDSGYRGVHLIYKYKNSQMPSYNGLLLELQIRTKLQHSWATAVEVMETFTGEALKSSQGSKEWLNFFALTSSAFAFLENRPRVPGFEHMSKSETVEAVKQAENALDTRRPA
jgi:putative GTP pyrophosphokinase